MGVIVKILGFILLIISMILVLLKARECYYCGSRNILHLFDDKAICRDCKRGFKCYAWLDKNKD